MEFLLLLIAAAALVGAIRVCIGILSVIGGIALAVMVLLALIA